MRCRAAQAKILGGEQVVVKIGVVDAMKERDTLLGDVFPRDEGSEIVGVGEDDKNKSLNETGERKKRKRQGTGSKRGQDQKVEREKISLGSRDAVTRGSFLQQK